MARLYELSGQYRFLSEALESDEFQEDQVKAKLAEIGTQFQDKAISIGKLYLSYESDASAIETEIARLSKRLSATKNKGEWLKSYLLNEMVIAGLDKIKGDVVTVVLRVNPPSVQVVNQDNIPADFWRTIPERKEVDRQKILINFKATGEIPNGCEVITNKKSIVIK